MGCQSLLKILYFNRSISVNMLTAIALIDTQIHGGLSYAEDSCHYV